jgi:hypothetical protein
MEAERLRPKIVGFAKARAQSRAHVRLLGTPDATKRDFGPTIEEAARERRPVAVAKEDVGAVFHVRRREAHHLSVDPRTGRRTPRL